MTRFLTRLSVFMLIGIFLFTSMVIPSVQAGMIETTIYLDQQNSLDRSALLSFMAREDVRNKMVALGVTPGDAANRIAALTDQEVSQLQERIDDLPAGSGLLAVLGIVLVVLIVLDLVGVTNVFNRL